MLLLQYNKINDQDISLSSHYLDIIDSNCSDNNSDNYIILPWYNSTFPQDYVKLDTYILLEDTFQPIILCVIGPLTMAVMYAPEFAFIILVQIGIPSLILFLSFWIITYWIYDLSLVWYDIDGPIMCVQYILICSASIYRLSILHKRIYIHHPNKGHTTYGKWKIFKYAVVPIIWLFLTIGLFGGPGLEFYLSLPVEFQFLFRTIIWPPLVQFTLGFAERLLLKMKTITTGDLHNNSSKLHAVLLAQACFAIYGRVMIFSGKNLTQAIILGIGHCVQEVLFHRWSRQMSRVSFWIRVKCMNIICCCDQCRDKREISFEQYFNSAKRKDYRSYIINIEYMIEIIGIISTSLIFITFYKYRYVLNFDYPTKDNGDGVDITFVVMIGLIQLLFEIISYFIIAYVENRFNKVHLFSAWTKLSHLQMISSVFIMIEAVVSASCVTRSIPNVINCTNRGDVCSCTFAIDWDGC